jgi:hypothetical protein
MRIAVTDHAVTRYKERVPGADVLEDETVRSIVREKVEEGFRDGLVRDHPTHHDRRIIPFKAGQSILYFSLGPNKSTTIRADLAVIGVLFEKELGKQDLGVTLGDVQPLDIVIPKKRPPRFMVQVGAKEAEELYRIEDEKGLEELFERRRPEPDSVLVYELSSKRWPST